MDNLLDTKRTLDEQGRMVVTSDLRCWYAYPDLTCQAEALYAFLERTVNTELVDELEFVAGYDRARSAIQGIVDLPDRKIDLFIRFCLEGNGRLSTRKRSLHFDMLTPDEIELMEDAVRSSFVS